MAKRNAHSLTRRAALRQLGVLTGGALVGCSASKAKRPSKADASDLAVDASDLEADAATPGSSRALDGGPRVPDGARPPLPPAPDAAVGCSPTEADAKGPFFEAGAPKRTRIAGDGEPGEQLLLDGTVLERDCETPVAFALLDVWQADAEGRYYAAGDTNYRLRGQIVTDAQGRWRLHTVLPGHYENGPGAWRPAHIHFTVSAPGFASVTTQLYFAGDPYLAPNDGCPTGCDSGDPHRIIELEPSEGLSLGTWRVVLDRA